MLLAVATFVPPRLGRSSAASALASNGRWRGRLSRFAFAKRMLPLDLVAERAAISDPPISLLGCHFPPPRLRGFTAPHPATQLPSASKCIVRPLRGGYTAKSGSSSIKRAVFVPMTTPSLVATSLACFVSWGCNSSGYLCGG